MARRELDLSPESRDARERPRKSGVALLGELGAYSALFIVGGLVAGLLLDHALRSTPVFLLIGVLGGFGAAMFQIVRVAMKEITE